MLIRRYVFVFVVMACIAVAGTAWAQTQITTGVIQGTVVDPSGAVVPGAEVEARNLDTNVKRTLTTGADGRFVFLQLVPGRYTVTVTRAGFATLVQENVTLTVGQSVNLGVTLKVSTATETVTVTGTPTVDTSRTEVSTTLNETTIATTPILGRKFEDLLTLTPGVSIVQGPDGDEITFSGQRGVFNNISLDGGDYNNGFFGEQMGGQRAAIDITLEAVKEFQVVAQGANAEFGRTAGGVINVITKSGTNDLHGSLFEYQRLEGLTSNTSDGKPLKNFHREQFGGTLGGPLVKDKAFFFLAFEGIRENLQRPNLSNSIGTPCSVQAPTLAANEALINGSADCQRLALLNFFRTTRGQEEGLPVDHTINNNALLAKLDWTIDAKNSLSISYNFDYSKNTNQTFDVATYGDSANGIEGPSKINVANLNLFSTVSATKLNEFHLTYSRESRPRAAVSSNVPADTAMGFATTFRFGNPFFLAPTVDELISRFQVKDNFSIVAGKHTFKVGGEWLHTNNNQIFRGFFEGRYIFDSVTGFLRYASPAAPGGYGPYTVGCSDGSYVTAPASCPAGSNPTGGPLLFFLDTVDNNGIATDAAGASNINNNEFSVFAQDQWQVRPNLTINYGLRWDAQLMPKTVDPKTTAFAQFLNDPRFPSDGTIPNQTKEFQPRLGIAWDIQGNHKSVLRANAGIYYARQNMLSEVGSVTANGLEQQTRFRNTAFTSFANMPTWPGILPPSAVAPGTFPLFTGVRVFAKDYHNPRIYTANVGFEQEVAPNWSLYLDFTWSHGVYLTRFINYNIVGTGVAPVQPASYSVVTYTGNNTFGPQLGDVFVTNSRGKGLYRGGTFGVRKRFSQKYQLEANYVLSKDLDDDSNERDPFTDRTFNFYNLALDYGPSDRDIRHKVNFFGFAELPGGLQANARIQARSAQPITGSPAAQPGTPGCALGASPGSSDCPFGPRVANGVDYGRNGQRKDNAYFSFDWRLQRPIRFGKSSALIPTVEMFNTFNSKNNVNTLTTPGLFNFDGFLRLGVGDPRQVQLSLKYSF
jgi:outer membrane receptor protein involved in Fe transport